MSPVALVTGGNKGIGYFISRNLLRAGFAVVIGGRDAGRVSEAAAKLRTEKGVPAGAVIQHVPLDLTDAKSIPAAVEALAALHPHLDVLVNNAGVYTRAGDPERTSDLKAAQYTVKVNFSSTVALTEALLPLLQKAQAGRVVMVASQLGGLDGFSQAGRSRLLDEQLTLQGLQEIAASYLVPQGTQPNFKALGFPQAEYNVSKALLNTYVRIKAREWTFAKSPLTITTCCPGWCKTDLTGGEGMFTPEEGADTPSWLATTNDKVHGRFFSQRKERAW